MCVVWWFDQVYRLAGVMDRCLWWKDLKVNHRPSGMHASHALLLPGRGQWSHLCLRGSEHTRHAELWVVLCPALVCSGKGVEVFRGGLVTSGRWLLVVVYEKLGDLLVEAYNPVDAQVGIRQPWSQSFRKLDLIRVMRSGEVGEGFEVRLNPSAHPPPPAWLMHLLPWAAACMQVYVHTLPLRHLLHQLVHRRHLSLLAAYLDSVRVGDYPRPLLYAIMNRLDLVLPGQCMMYR